MFVKLVVLCVFLVVACAGPIPHGGSWSYSDSDDWGIYDSESAGSFIIPAFSFDDGDAVDEDDDEEYSIDDLVVLDDDSDDALPEDDSDVKGDKTNNHNDAVIVKSKESAGIKDKMSKAKSVPVQKMTKDMVMEKVVKVEEKKGMEVADMKAAKVVAMDKMASEVITEAPAKAAMAEEAPKLKESSEKSLSSTTPSPMPATKTAIKQR